MNVTTPDVLGYLDGNKIVFEGENDKDHSLKVDELKEGDVMIRIDGSEEELTSIERHEGMHKNYAIKTKHNNFYANGILVDSVIQEKI